MDEHMQALADRFNAAADRLEKAGKIKTRWLEGLAILPPDGSVVVPKETNRIRWIRPGSNEGESLVRTLHFGYPADPIYIGRDGWWRFVKRHEVGFPTPSPDFTDPLTVLAVLLLVREASGDPCASVEFDHDVGAWFAGWTSSDGAWFAGWTNSDGFADEAHPAQTEIEALITALEDLAEETP